MDFETIQAQHLHTRLESTALPIILRVVELADAPAHAALLTQDAQSDDPNAKAFDAATSEKLITGQRESASKPTVCGADGRVVSGPGRVNMVVALKKGGQQEGEEEVIGLGGFGAIKDWERNGKKVRAGDAGVVLTAEHRGKGYAVEAMKQAINWAFTPVADGGPQLDIVTVTTLSDNTAMLNLTDEKLGLKGKGVLRPAEFGHPQGEMYYEVTADEWKKL